VTTEPATEHELLDRARSLAGSTIGEVSARIGRALPTSGHKGWIGTMIEQALGLTPRGAGPDAPQLGIEVKTTPIDPRGVPRETTFVCMVPRDGLDRTWAESAPHAKLSRVLFVPIEQRGALTTRTIGTSFLWSPDADDDALLASDWAELSGLLRAHGHEHVSARHGRVMQLRPKAARASSRWRATGDDGAPMLALPRAFYLRRTFVASIVSRSGLCGPRLAAT
jgi:DNA mismatch repair protein MutH